jgi:hypothetical protein
MTIGQLNSNPIMHLPVCFSPGSSPLSPCLYLSAKNENLPHVIKRLEQEVVSSDPENS